MLPEELPVLGFLRVTDAEFPRGSGSERKNESNTDMLLQEVSQRIAENSWRRSGNGHSSIFLFLEIILEYLKQIANISSNRFFEIL